MVRVSYKYIKKMNQVINELNFEEEFTEILSTHRALLEQQNKRLGRIISLIDEDIDLANKFKDEKKSMRMG